MTSRRLADAGPCRVCANRQNAGRVVALAGLLCAFAAASPGAAAAGQVPAVPDSTIDSQSAWLMAGNELLPPPSGPGPVTFDKRYACVDNAAARRAICAENNFDFLQYEVVPLPQADKPDF